MAVLEMLLRFKMLNILPIKYKTELSCGDATKNMKYRNLKITNTPLIALMDL